MSHVILTPSIETAQTQPHVRFTNGVSPMFVGKRQFEVPAPKAHQFVVPDGEIRTPAYAVVISETAGELNAYHRDYFMVDNTGKFIPEAFAPVGMHVLEVFQIFIGYTED